MTTSQDRTARAADIKEKAWGPYKKFMGTQSQIDSRWLISEITRLETALNIALPYLSDECCCIDQKNCDCSNNAKKQITQILEKK